MKLMYWDRPAPGGLLAIVGYMVLAVGVAAAFWMNSRALDEINEASEEASHEICLEQNRMREAMIEVQRERQPIPIPPDASPALQQSVEIYNERQELHIDRFATRMQPLECDEVR